MPDENVSLIAGVFESVADPLVIYDRDFRILRANPALLEMFLQTADQIVGKYCFELFYHRHSICDGCHVFEVFRSGEPKMCDKSIDLPGRGTRYFEVNAYPIRDLGGVTRQVVEHSRDITGRKKLETQLKASEERYRTIVQSARDGIFLLDDGGRITFVNQCFADMLGHKAETVIGKSMYEFLDKESTEVARIQHESRGEGAKSGYEVNLVGRDGVPFAGLLSVSSVAVNGTTLGEVGIITDINPLKQKERELQSAKKFTESIINSITDTLAVIDPRTYRIVQANDPYLKRTGQKSQNVLLKKTCFEVLLDRSQPCTVDQVHCPVWEAYATAGSAHMDKTYPNLDGSECIMEIAAYPLFDAQEKVELVVLLGHDVTEKRKIQQALAARSRELQKAQHQLESLFRISRQANVQGSIQEIIGYLYETAKEIFANSDPMFLLLDPQHEQILSFEEIQHKEKEYARRVCRRIEDSGLVRYLERMSRPQILTSRDKAALPPFLEVVSESYPSWFFIPLVCQQQSFGCFILGVNEPDGFSAEDLQFFQTLFDQVSGHIRHLILHEAELRQLRVQVAQRSSYGEIIGQSKRMQEVYELIDLVSGSDATVLITGENGTGKELVARAIHNASVRSRGPFIVANCSAYSPTLLESELFGHEKGAFTGAIRQVRGRIERAHGGTLFLDEIGDIAPATQILLLRFLQDRCFERVGGERTIEANVRILTATNRDLAAEVKGGRFRDDLYYRLNVISIHLPPLRARKDDTPLLAKHFLTRYSIKENKKILRLSSNCIQALMDYDWPGNVRQLENAISHASVLCQGETIRRRHLPRFLKEMPVENVSTSLAENERRLVLRVLEESGWNKHQAALRLQMSRSTLYSKIKRYGLKRTSGNV